MFWRQDRAAGESGVDFLKAWVPHGGPRITAVLVERWGGVRGNMRVVWRKAQTGDPSQLRREGWSGGLGEHNYA